MAKKIIVTGGGTVSGSRADYIAKSKDGELNQKEKRLFNSLTNDLTRHKANLFLGGNDKPQDGELTELIFSMNKKDFGNFGDTLDQQISEMEDVVREGLDNLWKELGFKNVRWVAGIHLNTNNPHAHIVFMRDFAQNIETGELQKIPKIPREWFYRVNNENSKLASFFETAVANHTKALPPESVLTRLPDENIFLPAKEFDNERTTKNLNRLSEVNHISPNLVEQLTDNRSLYVSRQGALTFIRRDTEGKTTGYVYESGYQPEEKNGFFYIGNPKTATRYILVENPKEALSVFELTVHRDLSEVCIVASDKNQPPAAFKEFIQERSQGKSIRVIWGLGLNREGNQEQTFYEDFQKSLLDNREESLPKLEFFSWQPKDGFGRNWSNQLQFRNLPGELNGIIKKINSTENISTKTFDLTESIQYENQLKETFASVIVEREDDVFVVYQKLDDGKGVEMGRYESLSPLETDEFASPEFSILNVNGKSLPAAVGAYTDELEVINEIQQQYAESIEKEFLESVAENESESKVLDENSANAEDSKTTFETETPKQLSAKEITEQLKEIPLEDVMPRLGLYLNYDKERREYVYRDDANIYKIKVKNNLWCDRYDDNRGGRNALNLVMHVEGKSFADARSFLLDNFGTEYIPQNTKEKAVIRANEEKPKAPFVMPETNENKIPLVYQYLSQERGISNEVITRMNDEGFIFANNFGSVGFVNKDENGNVKGASWRATKGTKRGDYTGTEKVNAWFYIGDLKTATKFVVVEAPIEAMSYYQLHQDKIDLQNTAIISTATNSVPMSLVNLLEKNAGVNAELVVAYNNDPKGQDGALYLLEKIGRFGMLKHKSHFENDLIETNNFSGKVTLEIPKLEDWNEDLKAQREVAFYEADNEHIADEIEIETTETVSNILTEDRGIENLIITGMEGKILDENNVERTFPVSFDSVTEFNTYITTYKPEKGTYKTDINIRLTDATKFEDTLLVTNENSSLENLLKERNQNLANLNENESYQHQHDLIDAQLRVNKRILNTVQTVQANEERLISFEENPALLEAEQNADYYEPEKIRSIKINVPESMQSFGKAEILLARDNPDERFFHVGYRFTIGGKTYESIPDRNAVSFAQGKQSLAVGYGLLRETIENHWKENGKPQFNEAELLYQPTEEKFLAKVLNKSERLARDFYSQSFEPTFAVKPELNQGQINTLKQWRLLTANDDFYRIENVFAGTSVESKLKRNAMYNLVSEGLVETKQDGIFTLVKGMQPLSRNALVIIGKEEFSKILITDGYVQESATEYLKIYAAKLKDVTLSDDDRTFYGKLYDELKDRASFFQPQTEGLFVEDNQTTSATNAEEIRLGENPELDYELLEKNPLKGVYDLKAHKIHQAFQEAYLSHLPNFTDFQFTFQGRNGKILTADENGILEVNFRATESNGKGKTSAYTLNQLIDDKIISKNLFVKLVNISTAKNEITAELEKQNLHTNYRATFADGASDESVLGFIVKSIHSEGDYVLLTSANKVIFTKYDVEQDGEQKVYSFNPNEQKDFASLPEAVAHLAEREEYFAELKKAEIEKIVEAEENQLRQQTVTEVSEPKIEVVKTPELEESANKTPAKATSQEKPLSVAEFFEKALNNSFKANKYEFEVIVKESRSKGEFDVFYKDDFQTHSEPQYRIYAPFDGFDEWTILKNNYDPVKNPTLSDFELTDVSFKTEEKLVNATTKRISKDLKLVADTITPFILPTAQQENRVEKRISKIIYAHKLADKIANSEDFHAVLKNEPFMDLHISMDYGTKLLRLTHYYEQNGDLMHDGEMNFKIEKNGKLKLNQTAAGLYGQPSYGYDRAFADIFSKNLLNQGFEKANLVLSESEADEQTSTKPETEFISENQEKVELSQIQTEAENNLDLTNSEKSALSDDEKTLFFEEYKFALQDRGIKQIVRAIDLFNPEERNFINLASALDFESAAVDIKRAKANQFIIVSDGDDPTKVQVSLTEKGELLNSYLQTNEVPNNFVADADQLALLKDSAVIQNQLDQKFAAKGLVNPFLVKIEYGNDFWEIGIREDKESNNFKGYPDYAIWKIDESQWQIAVGDVTPQTRFEPEMFDWLEPENKRFAYDELFDRLFEDELLPKTNLSASRISTDYRYPLALEVEPPTVKRGTISLANEVRELLHEGKSIGNNVAFNKMAEIHFGGTRAAGTFTARDAYDSLELGVNLYLLDQGKGFLDRPKSEVLTELNQLLRRLPTQTDRTDEQNLFQQFSTPPTESFAAFSATGLKVGDILLEPSAGNAGLALWSKLNGNPTHVNEISDRRAGILKIIGFDSISRKDAQFLNDTLDANIKPTVILMNPPFSATGGRTRNRTIYGAEHISDALLRLEEGGRLVAIVGEGMSFDKAGFTNWWSEIMTKYNVRANIGVQGEEYAKYGTNFGNQILVIDKNGATPGNNLSEQFANVITGDNQKINDVLQTLQKLGDERLTSISELDLATEYAEARSKAVGAVTGSKVDRIELKGYRIVFGDTEPKSDLYYEISGIITGGYADRLTAKGLTIEKIKFNHIEISEKILRQDLQNNPEKVYLFGDNLKQTGFGGQAKEMRGEPNAVGIPTKKAPSNENWAFFKDADYDNNKFEIDRAFAKLAKFPPDTILVVPQARLGTGLADLENKAPKTFAYLQERIEQIGIQNKNALQNGKTTKYQQTADELNEYLQSQGREDITSVINQRETFDFYELKENEDFSSQLRSDEHFIQHENLDKTQTVLKVKDVIGNQNKIEENTQISKTVNFDVSRDLIEYHLEEGHTKQNFEGIIQSVENAYSIHLGKSLNYSVKFLTAEGNDLRLLIPINEETKSLVQEGILKKDNQISTSAFIDPNVLASRIAKNKWIPLADVESLTVTASQNELTNIPPRITEENVKEASALIQESAEATVAEGRLNEVLEPQDIFDTQEIVNQKVAGLMNLKYNERILELNRPDVDLDLSEAKAIEGHGATGYSMGVEMDADWVTSNVSTIIIKNANPDEEKNVIDQLQDVVDKITVVNQDGELLYSYNPRIEPSDIELQFGHKSEYWRRSFENLRFALDKQNLKNVSLGENFEQDFDRANTIFVSQRFDNGKFEDIGIVELDLDKFNFYLAKYDKSNAPAFLKPAEHFTKVEGFDLDQLVEGIRLNLKPETTTKNQSLYPPIDLKVYQEAQNNNPDYYEDEDNFSPEEIRDDYFKETFGLSESVLSLTAVSNTDATTQKTIAEKKKNLKQLEIDKSNLSFHVVQIGNFFGKESEHFIRQELENKDIYLNKDNDVEIFQLGAGHLGSGLTIWNRAERENNDYKIIAHINPHGNLTVYDNRELPTKVLKQINDWKETSGVINQNQEASKSVFEKFTNFVENDERSQALFVRVQAKQRSEFFTEAEKQESFDKLADRFARHNKEVEFEKEELYIEFLRSQKVTVESVKTQSNTKENEQTESTNNLGISNANSSGTRTKQPGLFAETNQSNELNAGNVGGNADLSNEQRGRGESRFETQGTQSGLPFSSAERQDEKISQSKTENGVNRNDSGSVIAGELRFERSTLFLPETIDLKPNELSVYAEQKENLDLIGFETVLMNGKTVGIKTFPTQIKPNDARPIFIDILNNPEKISKIEKFGDLLNQYSEKQNNGETTPEEMENLLGVGKNTEKREKIGNLGVIEYKPAKLTKGTQHPADIVESASMAAVEPPDIKYTPKLAKEIIEEGKLSSLQLETVIYAGQRHEHTLPNGMRAGYFIGDGTGVGKGRELAGIALDNWNQGRKRVLWLSINYDLVPSTDRDLKDLGADIPLASLDKHSIKTNLNQAVGDGVLFSSYSTLIGKGKDGDTRFDQIVNWLGKDGVIFFDEGHLAKNAVSFGMSEASQRGEAVVDLQIGAKSNPNWRIVYSSATGATELRNMAYMQRLGLWGDGTGFPGGFVEFHNTIDKGGIGAMEMVSRDMKASGMLLSRSLSYRGVDYRQVHHELTPEQEEIYNLSAKSWSSVVSTFDQALQQTNANSRAKSFAYSRLWASQQMFYRQLMTALKVPALIRETERVTTEGSEYTDPKTGNTYKVPAQVIVGVIGTGEARTKEQVSKAMQLGIDLDNMDFSPKQILMNVVETGFPTKRYTEELDPVSGKTVKVPVLDENGKHLESREAMMMRDRLLAELEEKVVLPDNPLDQIVNYFGENATAEMTGRKRRIIINPETGQREYVKRAREGVAMDKASQDEMLAFQASRKSVAIISQSASTGISLHSEVKPLVKQYVADGRISEEKGTELLNHWNETKDTESTINLFNENGVDIFRRVHITLETSWSADTQMQTFGRSHRSNEVLPPEYVLMSTNLGGEKRFLSTIAKRLGSLGALTKGDRDQAGGGNLLDFDFENKYGTEAAKKIVTMLRDDDAKLMTLLPPHFETGEEQSGIKMLYTMGIARRDGYGFEVPEKTIEDLQVSRFLNRVLMLDVKTQNAVFDAFTSEMQTIVQHDKELGLFDEGVKDIEGENIRFANEPNIVSSDKATGANTIYYQINADTPTHPVTLKEISARNQVIRFGDTIISSETNQGVFYQQTASKNIIYVEKVTARVDAASGRMKDHFRFARPSGWQSNLLSEDELMQKYAPVLLDQVREFKDEERIKVADWWNQEVADTPKTQVHKYHIIGGAVLPVWQRLSSSNEAGNQMSLKTVRIETEEGERVVGVQIPSNHIKRVLRDLGVQQSYKTPEEIFDATIETKETVDLVGNIKLRPTFLKKQPTIEVMNLSHFQKTEFQNLGALKEIQNFDAKIFIPTEREKGIEVLSKILERYPAVDKNPQPKAEETAEEKSAIKSVADKFKEKIDNLTGSNGLPEGLLAKTGNESTPFAQIAKTLEKQPIANYWWMMKAEVNEMNQVVINPAAYELVRATYKHSVGVDVKNFDGLFHDENKTDKFFETLDRKVAQGGIYAESIASITKTLAEGRDRNEGLLVLLTDEKAAGHEDLHVASHVASLGKSLEDRHARFDELVNHEAYKQAKPILTKTYNTANDGVLVEELWNWSASGDAAKLNLTKEQAGDFVKLWFTSFAERNGTITKERFKEMTEDAKQIRDTAYRLVATENVQRGLSETEGISEPGRTLGNVSERAGSVGNGDNQTQSGNNRVNESTLLYKLDENSEPSNELPKDRVYAEFEKWFKNSNLETVLEAKDGAIHFETVGANPAHYQIEIFEDQFTFTEFEYSDQNSSLPREARSIQFHRDENGNYKYAGSTDEFENPDITFDDERSALFDIDDWQTNKIIATKIYLEPELEQKVKESKQITLESELAKQLGEQILSEIKVKEANFTLEKFQREFKNQKFDIQIEKEDETLIQPKSLKDLELEQIAYAKSEIANAKKTGILKMTAEDENISLDEAEKRAFGKAIKTANEFQQPLKIQLEVKIEEKQKEIAEKARVAEAVYKFSVVKETEAIKKQADGETDNVKPFIKPETIWLEQIKAVKRGDVETFTRLEELHQENQMPRPNDVYARLQGMQLISSLNAQKESKQYYEWTGEKAENQKYVVELKKDGDELKVSSLKLVEIKERHQELVETHNDARRNAEQEQSTGNRALIQPLMNKINPFSSVNGTLSWFTKPKETLNVHFNPIEIVKNDPGVQIIRAVYGFVEHSYKAQQLEKIAKQAAQEANLLKEQLAPDSVKKAQEMAEIVKNAVNSEETLRTNLKDNPLTNSDLLKTPERILTDDEIKEVGKLAQTVGDIDLVEKYTKVLADDAKFATQVGEAGERAIAKTLLSEAELANLSNQAIEEITFNAESVEVEISPSVMDQIKTRLETNDVMNSFRQSTVGNPNQLPRLTLEETADFDELVQPLNNQALDKLSEDSLAKYGKEIAQTMETPLNETEKEMLNQMKFSQDIQERFAEIQQSEVTADRLYQQAQQAIDNQIPFQNTGQNFTVTNPSESLEAQEREFWKQSRLQTEQTISQMENRQNYEEIQDDLAEIEDAEALEGAEAVETEEALLLL